MMHETWRWWLRGVAQYPQRSTSDQPFSPMQEVVLQLILLDGLLCQCWCQAVLLKPEKLQPAPRKRKHPPQKTSASERTPTTLPSPTIPLTPPYNTPLQSDLFSGTWVDNRSESQKKAEQERTQPAQMTLFRQREIAQFGVRAHPQMPLSPHTKLVLIAEDPRTEEEKERDLQRAAQALTSKLFPDEAQETVRHTSSLEPPPRDALPDEPPETSADAPQVRLALYLRLVQLGQAAAIAPESSSADRLILTALTVMDALHYGLRREEIHMALQIGAHHRDRQQRSAIPAAPQRPFSPSFLFAELAPLSAVRRILPPPPPALF